MHEKKKDSPDKKALLLAALTKFTGKGK